MKKRAATVEANPIEFFPPESKTVEEKEPEIPIGFAFSGFDSLGHPLSGVVPFETEIESRERLEGSDCRIDSIKPVFRKNNILSFGDKLPTKDELAKFAHEFGGQCEIGITPKEICADMSKMVANDLLRESLKDVTTRLYAGQTIYKAFAAQVTEKGTPIYPTSLIYALRIGVKVGSFYTPLHNFSQLQKRDSYLFSQIKKSLLYPKMVMGCVFIAFLFLVFYLIPKFAEFFTSLLPGKDDSLPFLTQFMLDLSTFLTSPFGICVTLLCGGAGYAVYYYLTKIPAGIMWRERKALRLPKFGNFYRNYHASVFCRMLALMWEGETNLAERFKVVAATTVHPDYREMAEHIENQVIKGAKINFLFDAHLFLMGREFRSVINTIGNGADAEAHLISYALHLEQLAADQIEKFLEFLKQGTLAVSGIFVITIALAIYWPLFSLVGKLASPN